MIFCLVIASPASAVLRDTEIENALRVYMQPLLQAGNATEAQLRIIVVADPTINAALLPGGHILVHSGLLLEAEMPTEVAGVLAHELGHYLNNDLLKLVESSEDNKPLFALGMALGLGVAAATESVDALAAGGLLGQHVGTRNQLKFTRGMESGADRRAIALLDRSGLGLEGIVALNKRLLELYPDPQNSDAQYVRTHPLTKDRIRYFESHLQRLGTAPVPLGWQEVHDRMRAKLWGFLDSPNDVLERFSEQKNTIPDQMARAIALMRLAQYDDSLAIMNTLLDTYPEDGFLHDLMGDIARHAGKPDLALQHYSTALEILPWASLIRFQRASLWLKKNTVNAALAARDDLMDALRFEPNTPSYWISLATAYQQLNEPARADLSKAESAVLMQNWPVAKSFAERARVAFSTGSEEWLRADDIMKQVAIAQEQR